MRSKDGFENLLSQRERQLLNHLIDGQTNKELANSMEISIATVKQYLRMLFAKFSVSNRTQLAIKAMQQAPYPKIRSNSQENTFNKEQACQQPAKDFRPKNDELSTPRSTLTWNHESATKRRPWR